MSKRFELLADAQILCHDAVQGANLHGALGRHWNNRKYGAGTPRFSTRKITSAKIKSSLGTRPQKY
jgi:hypothetical protein